MKPNAFSSWLAGTVSHFTFTAASISVNPGIAGVFSGFGFSGLSVDGCVVSHFTSKTTGTSLGVTSFHF